MGDYLLDEHIVDAVGLLVGYENDPVEFIGAGDDAKRLGILCRQPCDDIDGFIDKKRERVALVDYICVDERFYLIGVVAFDKFRLGS